MKKALLIILIAGLCSCGQTSQEKAELNVEKYMHTWADFPLSYEGIDFEKIEKDSITGYPWHILHLYREKNKKGEMVMLQKMFFLDSAYDVKKSMTLKQYNDLVSARQ